MSKLYLHINKPQNIPRTAMYSSEICVRYELLQGYKTSNVLHLFQHSVEYPLVCMYHILVDQGLVS